MKAALLIRLTLLLLLLGGFAAAARADNEDNFRRGIDEFGRKDYFVAILTFRKFMQDNDGTPSAFIASQWLARSYIAVGNRAAARKTVEELKERFPDQHDGIDPELLALIPPPPAPAKSAGVKGLEGKKGKQARAEKAAKAARGTKEGKAVKPAAQPKGEDGKQAAQPGPASGAAGGKTVFRVFLRESADLQSARSERDRLKDAVGAMFIIQEHGVYSLYGASLSDRERAEAEILRLARKGITATVRSATIPAPPR